MIKIIKLYLRNLNNKHLKAGGYIGRNVGEIRIKIENSPKTLNDKNHLRNLDNKPLKKAGEHISRNVVEITIKINRYCIDSY